MHIPEAQTRSRDESTTSPEGPHGGGPSLVRPPAEILVRLAEKTEPPPSAGKRFAAVVNSPAFLWFMSSVVIAGFGHWYTEHQKKQREEESAIRVLQDREEQREDRVLQLNVELGYRLRLDYKLPASEDLIDLYWMLNGYTEGTEQKPAVSLGSLRDYRGLPIEPIYFERCMLKKLQCNPGFEQFAAAVAHFKRLMRPQLATSSSGVVPALKPDDEPLITLRTAFLDVRMDAESSASVKVGK